MDQKLQSAFYMALPQVGEVHFYIGRGLTLNWECSFYKCWKVHFSVTKCIVHFSDEDDIMAPLLDHVKFALFYRSNLS